MLNGPLTGVGLAGEDGTPGVSRVPDVNLGVSELVLAALAVVLAAIAVKVGVSFDLNRWREERHRKGVERLQALCTHTEIQRFRHEGATVTGYVSLMTSPPGYLHWQCGRCGIITLDRSVPERHGIYWRNNQREWRRREKEFDRSYRRFYKVPR